MHYNEYVDGSHDDAARTEAELLSEVRHLVNESKGVALAAALDPRQTKQPGFVNQAL